MNNSRDLAPAEEGLVGDWIYTEILSSGGFSLQSELHMVLLPDRRCARATASVLSGALRDELGNWTGSVDSSSGLEAGDRGQWSATDELLELHMDDGSAYEYRYTLEGSDLLTVNTTGGQQRYWTRG